MSFFILLILSATILNSTLFCICISINSFPTSGDFCCLLITLANSLDPDQARRNVGPDLDPNCLVFLKDFFYKVNLKKKIHRQSMQNYPACKEVALKTAADDILILFFCIFSEQIGINISSELSA